MRRSLNVSLLIVTVLVTGLTGCTGKSQHPTASISISPKNALLDAPLTTVVHGLPANTTVTMTASAVAATGTEWTSAAEFHASANGTVSLDQAPLPDSGYPGSQPMGLFDSLEPPATSAESDFVPPPAGFDFTVRATVNGKVLASTVVHRQTPTAAGVTQRDLRVPSDGLYGELYRPASMTGNRPAVLVFGGSEGGLGPWTQLSASLLAARGYPTLALAYFDEPGLPQALQRIPLEYFAKALTLLRAQPDVDPAHVLVLGASRGGEAALLLGSLYPKLINGVIAGVPSSVVVPAPGHVTIPAWTLAGKPLPHIGLAELGQPNPPNDQAAVIKVEQIAGPVLLSCGGLDELWPSCPYVDAITARLKAHHFRYPVTALHYPDGGHFAGDFGGLSIYTAAALGDTGGSVAADEAGNVDGHATLLSFLAAQ